MELQELNDDREPRPVNSSGKAEYYIQQLNAANAKKVAFCLVLGFICYHGLIHLRYGTDSCKWLLSDGRFKGNREWQPYGCMMHKYSQMDTNRCLRYLVFWGKEHHFIFIGDSRLRALYDTFVQHLQTTYTADEKIAAPKRNEAGGEYYDFKLKLRIKYINAADIATMLLDFERWQADDDPPPVIVASTTQSQLLQGNITKAMIDTYSEDLAKLLPAIDILTRHKKIKVLWKQQDPVDEDKTTDDWKNVHNDILDRYNEAAYTILKYSGVQMWSSSRHIAEGLLYEAADGWQLSRLAAQHNIQILLNMYCNDYMNFNDGTCCSSAEPYTVVQVITYSLFGICVAMSVAISARRLCQHLRGHTFYVPLRRSPSPNTFLGSDYSEPLVAISILALILAYFYLCDRTNFFMKENKYYSEFSFWIPTGYIFVLGLFFTEDSRYTKVLHRDQTEELKGWMLIVILIYHLTGAERITPIYMHVKVLISGYLFLSGYNYFTRMWYTGDTSVTRFLQTLFRLNFATVLLCLCMNRPYQFYFFVPLISFWFVVVYFVLAIPPHITSASCDTNPYKYLYLVLKIVGLLAVSTVFYMSEVFFERIFVTRPWKALFVTTDDDIHEWWNRWKLDRYSITAGLIFAAVHHIALKFNVIDDSTKHNLFSGRRSIMAAILALFGIAMYTTFSFLCRNKLDCEEIHSYVSFVPIVGYMVLRNVSGIFRIRFSSFFAWFGHISVELFICQYHIWLAADRNGVLVLLPGFPNLNILLSCFIFVCASHEMHRVTQVLLPYAVPNDWRIALRNVVIFMLLMIPLGKYDGMF